MPPYGRESEMCVTPSACVFQSWSFRNTFSLSITFETTDATVTSASILTSHVDNNSGKQQYQQKARNQRTATLLVVPQLSPGKSNVRITGQDRIRSAVLIGMSMVVMVVVMMVMSIGRLVMQSAVPMMLRLTAVRVGSMFAGFVGTGISMGGCVQAKVQVV